MNLYCIEEVRIRLYHFLIHPPWASQWLCWGSILNLNFPYDLQRMSRDAWGASPQLSIRCTRNKHSISIPAATIVTRSKSRNLCENQLKWHLFGWEQTGNYSFVCVCVCDVCVACACCEMPKIRISLEQYAPKHEIRCGSQWHNTWHDYTRQNRRPPYELCLDKCACVCVRVLRLGICCICFECPRVELQQTAFRIFTGR